LPRSGWGVVVGGVRAPGLVARLGGGGGG